MPMNTNALNQEVPQPTPPRRPNRPKEFWEVEPGDPEVVNAWRDNPEDPTGSQGAIPQEAEPIKYDTSVVVTPSTTSATSSKYIEFVDQVTSAPSKDNAQFIARVASLQAEGCDIQRLLTAAVGIAAEGGEFMEIVKKITFQGKPWNADNIDHLKIELGDVMWYVAQACMALDISLEEVLDRNISKLAARYPEGTFDAYYSENRKAGDR
jgi:NTP pyrophosphatase (non-canonical NTP hydrolase)